MKNNFEIAWERLKLETKIKSQKELAEALGLTQSAITEMKKTGKFPKKWAYLLENKYKLSAEWILSGEGEKKIKSTSDDFFQELEEWGREMSGSENIDWMKNQIENHFPGFVEWKKKRN